MLLWYDERMYPLMRAAGPVKIEMFRKDFYTSLSTTNNKNNLPNWLNEMVEVGGFQQLSVDRDKVDQALALVRILPGT